MRSKNPLTRLIGKLPYFRALQEQHETLSREKSNYDRNCRHPPGHYYSSIVSIEEIRKMETRIWRPESTDGIAGIDLHSDDQLKLVRGMQRYYDEMPFKREKQSNLRFYLDNYWYHFSDAILLYAMLRQFTPKKIIEVGSGFSSALMLDTNDVFLNGQIDFTFIEPDPERLFSILSAADRRSATIIEQPVQFVPASHFERLDAGDILFIDSSHVVKTASDVNYLLFEILPRLRSGVLIHFHDIFYPFEYPKKWVFEGWNWNENYFLRAFLMYNDRFRIKLFSHYLHVHHKAVFANMPLSHTDMVSGCLWLEKN